MMDIYQADTLEGIKFKKIMVFREWTENRKFGQLNHPRKLQDTVEKSVINQILSV